MGSLPTPTNRIGDLAVLYASKHLHDEITEELYRNRVLTICLGDQDHLECYKDTGDCERNRSALR